MNPFHYLDDPRRDISSAPLPPASTRYYPEADRFAGMEADGSGKLLEYVLTLYRHKGLLLAFALVGLVVTLGISLPQKPIYRAQVAVEIQDPSENFLNKGFDNSSSPNNGDQAEAYFQTQIRLLRSESLLQRVAAKLNLRDQAKTRKPSIWRAWLGLPQKPLLSETDRLIKQLGANLTVRVSGLTRVVEVLYESPDPALAADVANTVVTEFIEQSQEVRWRSAQRAGEWLTRQLAEMKVKLEKSDAQLQGMARDSGLAIDSGKDSIEDAKLRTLEDELSKAQAESLSRQSKLELAGEVSAESLPEILDDPTIRDYSIKLTDLRRQLAELSSSLTPAHYRVQQVEQQIVEMRGALDRARTNLLSRIRNDYEDSQRHVNLLQAACTEQLKLVAKASHKAVEYNMMKHEVDTSRQLYEILLQRVKEAGVASAMRASNVLIVDPARRPVLPFKPNLPFNAAIGFAGGIFIGIGFVFFREQANGSVREPGELSVELNLPDLGTIPDIRQPFRVRNLPRASSGGPEQGLTRLRHNEAIELRPRDRKSSLLAESFRATLPSILFGQPNTMRPRVIVITSPNPGEGKTTVAVNLAVAIAEITDRVLVVDGDLRKHRLNNLFGVQNEFGLADLLSLKEQLTAAKIEAAVQGTGLPGLFVLTSGSEQDELSSLFYSRRLPELLALLRKEFDTIIIDSPPLLQIPDGRLLGRFADGMILVLRAGMTARESAILARQRLADDGSPVLGTILNSWEPAKVHRYTYAASK
ncbi:MAG TPA: polysaccharide biosynthesis tyrosine autokinase [Bryobacteraceae bacterium]|nr:polysaccharide biosynthesis tyrosine autokinase [Bryobacteraceae bacterium]